MGVFLAIAVLLSCSGKSFIQLDPDSEAFYKKARLLMTKEEKDVFLSLSTKKEREEFIKMFWEIRDPDPYTEVNEYKVEIEKRFRYAERYFKEPGRPGWNSDRGRVYILLGPPDEIRDFPMLSGPYKGIIYWIYGNYQLIVRFVDHTGNGVYELSISPSQMIQLSTAMEKAKFMLLSGESTLYRLKEIKFKVFYKENIIFFKVKPKNLSFKKMGNKLKFGFDIRMIVYSENKRFRSVKRKREVELLENDILKGKDIEFSERLGIFEKGKYTVDIIITDIYSGIRARKIVKIKIKK